MANPHLWRLGLAAAGGATVATCFLSFSVWPLGWIAFAPITLAAVTAPGVRAAIVVGLVAGLATNVPAFRWLVGTIHAFGGFPIAVAAIFYGALSVYSSGQLVLFAVAVRRAGFGPLALAPAAVWVALELLYPNLFPWRLANSQLEVPALLQIGEITGPFGLSFVMVWVSSALARAARDGLRVAAPALATSGAAALAVLAFGLWRMPAVEGVVAASEPVNVALVQGNLSIEEKGNVHYFESNLAVYRRLTLEVAERADVVIWPETVIGEPLPRTLARLPRGAVETLGLRKPLLTGALTYAGSPDRPRFYNSVVLFGEDGEVLGLSDKQILMPFGEFMPFGSVFPFLKALSPQTGDFEAGEGVVVLDVPGAGRFAPLNCYEDLRASIPRASVVQDGAQVLFAVANDAWFGNTMAPFQHEALALWRAVENRRYLVRVTNTGVSDVIDPLGRVAVRLPVFEAEARVAEVRLLDLSTPYHRVGNLFAWLAAAGALVAILRGAAPR